MDHERRDSEAHGAQGNGHRSRPQRPGTERAGNRGD
jgi:hypothetical protein